MSQTNDSSTSSDCEGNTACCADESDTNTMAVWNSTLAGNTAAFACELLSLFGAAQQEYVATGSFALRTCDSEGTWMEPDYSACVGKLRHKLSHGIMVSRVLSGVYVLGGGLSMVLLSVALFIFCFFKNLHCKRIWIHCNLVLAFIMRHIILLIRLRTAFPFIVMTNQKQRQLVENRILQLTRPDIFQEASFSDSEELDLALASNSTSKVYEESPQNFNISIVNNTSELSATIGFWTELLCKVNLLVDWYTFLCTFFWMFVEAAYLYVRITISVFDGDNAALFRRFCILGWGGPLVLVFIYAIVLHLSYRVVCWEDAASTDFGWLLYGPSLAMLAANVYFMIAIIAILVTKLKGTESAETEQIRVALRAIGFLVPLFGLMFLVMVVPISQNIIDVYRIMNAVLQSLQGSAVALIYCFINQEVHQVIKSWFKRFKTLQNRNPLVQYAALNMNIKREQISPTAMTLSV